MLVPKQTVVPNRGFCVSTVTTASGKTAPVTPGELDSELHLLYNTFGDRIEAIEAARLANALTRLSIGDRVRSDHDVRPGYLHGLPATVIRPGTDTITIQLDRPVGKFADGCIRCSSSRSRRSAPE
jgi:hypothetical protein